MIDAESVDLVILDPGSSRDFGGKRSRAHIPRRQQASPPEWGPGLDAAFQSIGRTEPDFLLWAKYVRAVAVEAHRLLAPSGSIFLETTDVESSYARVLLDNAFGPDSFRNEIVRRQQARRSSARGFPRTTARLLYYVKSQKEAYFDNVRRRRRRSAASELLDQDGTPLSGAQAVVSSDIWSYSDVPVTARERLGVRGQDPLGLARRIIRAAAPPGGTVLDPFCGSGTFLAAAHNLNRRWIGVDSDYTAITTVKHRASNLGITAEQLVVLDDLPASAAGLAKLTPEEFELWVLGQLGARPFAVTSEDRGFDGQIFRYVEGRSDPIRVLVEVKASQQVLGPREFQRLTALLELQNAEFGLLVSASGFTREAQDFATRYGTVNLGGVEMPRLQVLTGQDLLDGDYQLVLPHGTTDPEMR